MSSPTSTDRIERQVRLDHPCARVWCALTNAREFGQWFGVALTDEFVAGQTVHGRITHPGYEHVPFEAVVETMEPEHHFAFRWHPYAIEVGVDYAKEPRTLVTFTLVEDGDATVLTVVESGFDPIPASRRAKAFEMDAKGWAGQMKSIEKYLAADRQGAPGRPSA